MERDNSAVGMQCRRQRAHNNTQTSVEEDTALWLRLRDGGSRGSRGSQRRVVVGERWRDALWCVQCASVLSGGHQGGPRCGAVQLMEMLLGGGAAAKRLRV